MATPGRNDRCPCGSGRKFKHCCLQAFGDEDSLRLRLRHAEGTVMPALFKYVAEEFGQAFFQEAWDEFVLWEDGFVPSDSPESGTTFEPFLAFSYVPDEADEDLPEDWPTEPLGQHFLRHRGESLQHLEREFIEQACRSPASFFVVESVVPGRSMDLTDILTGRRFHVLEQSASQALREGDITFTRVITAGGASIMIGASQWTILPSWHVTILDFRDTLRKKGKLTREELLDYDMEIRSLYLEIAEAIEHPRLPELQNTDGDPIELTTLTYELHVPIAEAVERLVPLATLHGETHISDETHDSSGTLTGAVLGWLKAGNRRNAGWDNTALGTLRLEGSRLVAEVNSARRRARLEKEIAKRLGASATLIETQVTDIMAELEKRRRLGLTEPADSEPEDSRTPEIEALEAEFNRKQWDAWIDTKVPALGNRTPRQAAKTESGRERLEALLSDFARAGERGPSGGRPPISELRQKLGLD